MKTAIRLRFPMLAALVGGLLVPATATAQNLMVGFNRIECPPRSDTLVSVPFMKHPVAAVLRVSGSPDLSTQDRVVLALGQNATWSNDSLKDTHYVRFTSGARAGHWYDIAANTAASLTLDLNGGDGTSLAAGDGFLVVEYWTLDSLFPPSSQRTFHQSIGNLGYQQKSKLLIPNVKETGTELPADGVYFLTAEGWKQSTVGFPLAGDTILPPGLPFIIRHPDGVDATDFEPEGRVLRSRDSLVLAQAQSINQDNIVAVFRPVDLLISNSGLDESAFVSSASHAVGERKDELLLFDNSLPNFNKSPTAIFYKLSNSWFKEQAGGVPSPVTPSDVLSASSGLIIRKSKGNNASAVWNNDPSY